MSEPRDAPSIKTKIFVSYARSDSSDLAAELVTGLNLAGFEAALDKHDIERGEDWQERLRDLILQADTIVFIISPAAIRSKHRPNTSVNNESTLSIR